MVERNNYTLVSRLRVKLLEKPNLKWSTLLSTVVSEYNSTPHHITGFKPRFLMFGHKVDSPNHSQDWTLEQCRRVANDRTRTNQSKRKELWDKHHKDITFKPNELVLREIADNSPTLKKLGPRFEGPYRILRQKGPNVYEVARYDDDPTPLLINISQLRRFSIDNVHETLKPRVVS